MADDIDYASIGEFHLLTIADWALEKGEIEGLAGQSNANVIRHAHKWLNRTETQVIMMILSLKALRVPERTRDEFTIYSLAGAVNKKSRRSMENKLRENFLPALQTVGWIEMKRDDKGNNVITISDSGLDHIRLYYQKTLERIRGLSQQLQPEVSQCAA